MQKEPKTSEINVVTSHFYSAESRYSRRILQKSLLQFNPNNNKQTYIQKTKDSVPNPNQENLKAHTHEKRTYVAFPIMSSVESVLLFQTATLRSLRPSSLVNINFSWNTAFFPPSGKKIKNINFSSKLFKPF